MDLTSHINALFGRSYDTRLTRAGRQKAAELAASISSLQPPPQLVLVSPLTRCLETASLALGLPLSQGPDSRGGEDSLSGASSGSGVASGAAPLYRPPLHAPVVAEPLLRERVTLSSEVGRPAALLRRDFTAVDFSRVEAAAAAAGRRQRWWWTGPTGADNLGPDDYDDAEASTSSSSSRGGSGAPGAAPRPKSMSRTVVKEPEGVSNLYDLASHPSKRSTLESQGTRGIAP